MWDQKHKKIRPACSCWVFLWVFRTCSEHQPANEKLLWDDCHTQSKTDQRFLTWCRPRLTGGKWGEQGQASTDLSSCFRKHRSYTDNVRPPVTHVPTIYFLGVVLYIRCVDQVCTNRHTGRGQILNTYKNPLCQSEEKRERERRASEGTGERGVRLQGEWKAETAPAVI